ncbi:MAG: DUF1512 family protein, partial [Desulfurococcaceae archaeon]
MNGDTVSLITQLIWIALFVLIITGLNQRIQMKLWIWDIRSKMNVIKNILEEDKSKVKSMLKNLGIQTPEVLINRLLEFFTINPVEIEPTDIIRRLNHLLRTTEISVKKLVEDTIPHIGKYERSLVESSISIV